MAKIFECSDCGIVFTAFTELTGKDPRECPGCSASLPDGVEFFSEEEFEQARLEYLGIIQPDYLPNDDEYDEDGRRIT